MGVATVTKGSAYSTTIESVRKSVSRPIQSAYTVGIGSTVNESAYSTTTESVKSA